MGCCESIPTTNQTQVASHSEMSVAGTLPSKSPNMTPKVSQCTSFSARIEKNYSTDDQETYNFEIKQTTNKINQSAPLPETKQTTNKINQSSPLPETKQIEQKDTWDLDASEREQHKKEFQQKIADKQHELQEEHKRMQQMQDQVFEQQVTRQRAKTFVGLYALFETYATNADKTKMDIDGLTEALSHFGMIISADKAFQKLVYSKFDIDKEGEFDYNDFSATMSSFIGTKNDDSLMLMFQIFDIDQDGYLTTEDMARILLAQNHIVVVLTGQQGTKRNFSKGQCLKLARKMITKYDSDAFNDDKISFHEYCMMMKSLSEVDMMIDNMVSPSMSNLSMDVAKMNIDGQT